MEESFIYETMSKHGLEIMPATGKKQEKRNETFGDELGLNIKELEKS
jgi:hypothetical protein